MARTARVKEAFGTYYITQSSSGCRPLFMCDEDRQFFIKILQSTVDKFNCRIIEYCVQANDTYHLIVDVNGGDLSKIMKSINIPYGMYAVCDGKLFKDRYKSESIESLEHLDHIRASIQQAVIDDGGFSSFCISEITPCTAIEAPCTDCILTKDEAYEQLTSKALTKHGSVEAFLKDKPSRNNLIKSIRRTSTLSMKDIGDVFGGLSESTVSKILNQK